MIEFQKFKGWLISIFLFIFILGLAQCNQKDDLKSGKEIYQVYCVNCHGVDGRLAANAALDLSLSRLPLEGRVEIIKHGRVTMMGFEDVLTEAQIDSVAQYTLELQEE